MPIIPRYQSRGGPRVQTLDYAGAYQPPGGEDWRMLAQAARAGGAIVDGAQAFKEPHDPSSERDVVKAKTRDVDWRRQQLERPQADVAAVARSRDVAGEGLEPAARAAFDLLTGPREAGFAAAATGRVEAEQQAIARQLSEDREALGVEEYVALADLAPDQARAALGSAIGELTGRLAAMGASPEAIDLGRRGLLNGAIVRRVRHALAENPKRAETLLDHEGELLDPTVRDGLRLEVETEQTRHEAGQAVQRLAAKHHAVEDDLDGLLARAEALAGGAPDRQAAYRGAAIGAWRSARQRREEQEGSAWSAVKPYLDPELIVGGWTAVPGAVWTALSARQKTALRSRFEAPWKGSDPRVVRAVEGTALRSTEAFAEMDLTGLLEGLDGWDFSRLSGLQKLARVGGPDWEQARRRLPEVDPAEVIRADWSGEDGGFIDRLVERLLMSKKERALLEKMQKDAPNELDRLAEAALGRFHDRMAPTRPGPQIDWAYIQAEENGPQWEGGPPKPPRTEGYIPIGPGVKGDHSGVTIASGVDLGQRSLSEVEGWGLDPALLARLKPYIGLRSGGAALLAENKRKGRPLTVTPEEARQLDEASHSRELKRLAEKFDADSKIGPFESLPKRTQTVLLSVFLQHGTSNPGKKAPRFWGPVTTGDWPAAHSELLSFGDISPDRRRRDAALLKQDIDEGLLKPKTGAKEPASAPQSRLKKP